MRHLLYLDPPAAAPPAHSEAARPWPQEVNSWSVLSSRGDRHYRVVLFSDGRWACTCPDFEYRAVTPGYACKHIEGLQTSPGIT